jgi:transposase
MVLPTLFCGIINPVGQILNFSNAVEETQRMTRTSGDCPECGETYIHDDFQFIDPPDDEDATPDEYWFSNEVSMPGARRAWECRHCDTVTQTVEISLDTLFRLVEDSPAKLAELEQYFPSAPNSTLSFRRSFAPLFRPSAALVCVIGEGHFSSGEVMAKLWTYINAHGLQDKRNKRLIRTDAALERVFGAEIVDMFDLSDLISVHLSDE